MANFINLAMQNSQAEQVRKKRKKADIEDSLLSGGLVILQVQLLIIVIR